MKLVQFMLHDNKTRIGVLQNDHVIDVNAFYNFIPNSLVEFLNESHALHTIETIVEHPSQKYLLSDVTLLAPITKPGKIIGIDFNHSKLCDEINTTYPKEIQPYFKIPSTVIGPYDDIVLPTVTKEVDWQIELAVVMGKTAKNVEAADALDYVVGYTIAQDITSRDWERKGNALAKSMDTFCPLGPCLVTKEELGNPYEADMKTWVNGTLQQEGNTSSLLFKIDEIIEHLSSIVTLVPGDIILTGTPPGIGMSQKPAEFLKRGDLLESEITGIGKLANLVC